MKLFTLKSVFILSIVLFLIACTSAHDSAIKEQKGEGQPVPYKKEPLAKHEAMLNPSEYDEEVEIVRRFHEARKKQSSFEILAEEPSIEKEVIQGFRIQLFATPNIDEANREKGMAIQRFYEDSTYVVYDPPVYKVRVGDFQTRFDASKRLPFVISLGYPDAWIVGDRIIVRKKSSPLPPKQ